MEPELNSVKTPEELEMDAVVERVRKDLDVGRDRLMHHVNKGVQGLNVGMNLGLPTVNQRLDGTQRGTYYLIGADSSVGKTTLADFMFVYSLYIACKAANITLDLDYYSYEISLPMKKAKWASLLYYLKYGEELSTSIILGRKPGFKLTSVQYKRIELISKEIEEMFDSFHFVENPTKPTDVWKRWVKKAENRGKVLRDRTKTKDEIGQIKGFVPIDPTTISITIVDHLALTELEKGMDTKHTMDLQSTLAVRARNIFDESIVFIQQFNNSLQAASRDRRIATAYLPTRMDFGDTTYTYRDADVVLGLTKPSNFQLESFGPYTDLDEWGKYFLVLSIMKNRYGSQDHHIPLFMNSIAGIPAELPRDELWNSIAQDKYIEKAKRLDKLWQ